MDLEVPGGDSLNKIIEIEQLSNYLNKDCTIHVISKYGKQDFANYVNLTKLLRDSIIVVSEEGEEQLCSDAYEESFTLETNSAGIDKGKIIALHNAGWTGKQIAEEMRCSTNTVYNTIKKYKKIESSYR